MPLAAGTRVGPYEIVAPLGAGGMGEVYKARDSRLGRLVAIKLLTPALRHDPALRSRLEREARTVAALSHPHICALHDVATIGEDTCLVMEYLEGETLAARLARGPLPLSDIVAWGAQIADALDRSHRAGVVHRDLKPSNVMLTRDGVKLLDFGIARHCEPGPAEQAQATGTALTATGAIVGTLHYMAPEQLEGRESDARADLFSLGALLYEMAAGQKAFDGPTPTSVMTAVLTASPTPLPKLQPQTPPALDRLVRRCLAKDPERRWQNARDVALELESLPEQSDGAPGAPRGSSTRALRSWQAAALGILVLALVLAAMTARRFMTPAPDALPARFVLTAPAGGVFAGSATQVAVAPDGRTLAFVASAPERPPVIWLRTLDSADVSAIPGTENGIYPFWSPDGRAIGFFADGRLKTARVPGGPVHSLADAPDPRGGTWRSDGTILYAPRVGEGLQTIAATGGDPTAATTLDGSRRETGHRWPAWLPGERRFLYHVRAERPDAGGIYAASLDGAAPVRVLPDILGHAVFMPPNQILFVRDGALLAQRFDQERLAVEGEPHPISPQVGLSAQHYGSYSAAPGVVAFAPTGPISAELRWFDRRGQPLGSIGEPGEYLDFAVSPDGTRLAASRMDPRAGTPDIWILDVRRGISSRFTLEPRLDASPIWSPDGQRLVFRSDRVGSSDLFVSPAAAAGREQVLLHTIANKVCTDLSPDGRLVVYHTADRATGWDIWTLPLDGGGRSAPLIKTRFDELFAVVSPDGRWLAYTSNRSGRQEIYVQPFDRAGDAVQVSTNGGSESRWGRDGRELFYLDDARTLMAVPVTSGRAFDAGAPLKLFQTRALRVGGAYRRDFIVSPDSARFLLNTVIDKPDAGAITVLVNWRPPTSDR